MSSIKEIISICKEGRTEEAYSLAQQDLDYSPDNIWAQRAMFWALYYSAKADIARNNTQSALSRLDQILNLSLIGIENDEVFSNTLLRLLSEIAKGCPADRFDIMDSIFAFVQHFSFAPSREYSFFLKECCKMKGWDNLVAFIEWWRLDNLLPEDYQKYRTDKGKEIMSIAESVFIAYSKALLKLNDKQKIRDFLPRLEHLAQEHRRDMMYPGYYCAKLMFALGSNIEQILGTSIDFIRTKRSEFWLWQSLSEMFINDEGMWLACILRASHCNTEEKFLVNVRLRLMRFYLTKNDFPRAKYQLTKIIECKKDNNWNLGYEITTILNSQWYNVYPEDKSDPIDYLLPTDGILLRGANESIAVVANVDRNAKKAYIIYAKEKTTAMKFKEAGFTPKQGDLLKVKWVADNNGRIRILSATLLDDASLQPTSYFKRIEGETLRRDGQNYAFIKTIEGNYFVAPEIVKKYSLENGTVIKALAVLNYNKKKDVWNWICIKIEE